MACFCVGSALADDVKTVTVNEYFGVKYVKEPVSFDVEFKTPVPAASIFIDGAPSQVEVLAGTRDAVTKARVWTAVEFDGPGQKAFKIVTGRADQRGAACEVKEAGEMGGVKLAVVSNGSFSAKVPVGSATFATGKLAMELPGPVVSVSGDAGKTWFGSGYLDTILRCKSVRCEVDNGPVYFESMITYAFEDNKTYKVRVRAFAAKPYAQLVEDFNLGGNARFIFSYDDWAPPYYVSCSDQAQTKMYSTEGADASDFVKEEGQRCLVRMVVWTQFGYFGGKSETIGLVDEKGDLAVGGFFVRPDLWTRAKVNHVDLYERPEVPGDRMTRGVVGLAGSKNRYAMEAWLIDGHREWALYAMPTGPITPGEVRTSPQGKGPEKAAPPKVQWGALRKAHVVEGVWPLDRLNRTAFVWNSDGSPVAIENQKVTAAVGGTAAVVLKAMDGRSGLQAFNGSEGRLRGTAPPPTGWDGKVRDVKADPSANGGMIDAAACAYFGEDESAYPSFRAMLPWTHPEAINPFYQGMENMNFNADRYRYVFTYGLRLAAMGHPQAKRFIDHGIKSFDMALDRYVYPQSGCWEESHGYAGHTIKTVESMIQAARNSGMKDFTADPRFARMVEFFIYAHSAKDAEFGNRIVPPIGDHGLNRGGPAARFKGIVDVFLGSKNPEVQRIVRRVAWMIEEDGSTAPVGITPEKPDLSSRYLQGYGVTMRAVDTARSNLIALSLPGALPAKAGDAGKELTLTLVLGADTVRGTAKAYNSANHTGTYKVAGTNGDSRYEIEMTIADDKWVKGGPAKFSVKIDGSSRKADGSFSGAYTGSFRGVDVKGEVTGATSGAETFVVLRSEQSWGHHHEDKGSLWGWFRNVHFFGDASWGGPPGGTYWNQYKQGPPGHTEIEFVGINNWTLPCKYPSPWISDDRYEKEYSYANGRCMYPYNPRLDLSKPSAPAMRNGYDRQVLLVHPDLLIVRDNVQTTCPTIWRLHSLQPKGTTLHKGGAKITSGPGVTGHLAMLFPRDVEFTRIDGHDLNGTNEPFGSSCVLRWNMPLNTSATWTFGASSGGEAEPRSQMLDQDGKVTRIKLADGRELIVLMNIEPFAFSGEGIEFAGTVGLVARQGGRTTAHAIRAAKLTAN
jgi:hypothetical protein